MATATASADFNGSTNVSYGDIDLLEGSSAFTSALWFKLDSIAFESKIHSEWDNQNQFLIDVFSDGSFQMIAEDGANRSRYGTAAGVITTGVWYFAASVWSGQQNWKFYLDGVDTSISNTGSSGTVNSIGSGNAPYAIAGSNIGSSTINGQLAYIHLYEKALTFAETEEIRRKPASINDGLLSFIPCWNSGTSICRDLVLNSDGTINGVNLSESQVGPAVFLLSGQ